MFFEYYEELGGKIIKETFGFVAYQIFGENCYLEHMYVQKALRKSDYGTRLLQSLEDKARESGCTLLYTTISIERGTPEITMIAAMKRGFKFARSDESTIFLSKEL